MTQKKKQKQKTLALSTLSFLGISITSIWSDERPATLFEYIMLYRRNSVWFAILCTGGASVMTFLVSTTANNWLWIWPCLTILLVISEVVRFSQFKIESKIFPWVDTLRAYALEYDQAIKVWNVGLKYSIEEALDTNNAHQLIQKYWELQFARRYLSECIEKALKHEMKDGDWQKLGDYMKFFKENCTRQ